VLPHPERNSVVSREDNADRITAMSLCPRSSSTGMYWNFTDVSSYRYPSDVLKHAFYLQICFVKRHRFRRYVFLTLDSLLMYKLLAQIFAGLTLSDFRLCEFSLW